MTVVPIEERSPLAVAQAGRMTPAVVKQQAEEIRELMRAALTEGVDFGRIPSTPKPTLYQPGAQWLLKWAGYGFTNRQGPIILDGVGRPFGVTYTCSVHLLGDGDVIVATCDGYAGYDEPDREQHENKFGKIIPRSPWNTIIKMAQKRALVGAALAATAASGIFTQDVEDMPATADPNEEFRRHGWKDQAEADETRTRQATAIKDGKLAKEFNAWRQQADVKVPPFSDGWHSKKEADQIDEWLQSLGDPAAQEPEGTAPDTAPAAAGEAEKKPRARKAKEAAPAPENAEETPQATAEQATCEHEYDETDEGRQFCVLCGLVG